MFKKLFGRAEPRVDMFAQCNPLRLFKNVCVCVTICTDTCLKTLSSLVNCSVNNDLSEIGPYRN